MTWKVNSNKKAKKYIYIYIYIYICFDNFILFYVKNKWINKKIKIGISFSMNIHGKYFLKKVMHINFIYNHLLGNCENYHLKPQTLSLKYLILFEKGLWDWISILLFFIINFY